MTRDVAALVAQDTLGRVLARQLRHLVMRDVPLTPSEKIPEPKSSIPPEGRQARIAESKKPTASPQRSPETRGLGHLIAAVLFDLTLDVLHFIERASPAGSTAEM
jgi:hypothetical protein